MTFEPSPDAIEHAVLAAIQLVAVITALVGVFRTRRRRRRRRPPPPR